MKIQSEESAYDYEPFINGKSGAKKSSLSSGTKGYSDTGDDKHPLITDLKPMPASSYSVTRDASKEHYIFFMRIFSAFFYGISSFLIIVINKVTLTSYGFPSFHVLGIGQMVATIFILHIAKKLKIITYPHLSRETWPKVFPLPLFYLGNLVCGLGGTKRLSLPMFTVLRRFTILMTALGEYWVLGVVQSPAVIMTIVAMIGGAMIAASYDLAFDAEGYSYVLCNDFFTAANGVIMKKKLESKHLGKYGLLYYNALFMILPLLIFSWVTGDLHRAANFDQWDSPGFWISFLLSCVMGFVLMYSTVLCTACNSALTTTIVGCLKNIFVTFYGMYLGGDYVFSVTNFIGINISMVGSIVYSYVTFLGKESRSSGKTSKPPSPARELPSAVIADGASSSNHHQN